MNASSERVGGNLDKRRASGALFRAMANPDTEALVRARLFQSSNPDVTRRLTATRPRARSLGGGEIVFEKGR